ncbi:MAG TPA: CPBP family intramembrane metalloprotease [Blastocatellia bacterium]|nr:CPBP family intramembrane metalloprotease [Blastocatellia bacterium]
MNFDLHHIGLAGIYHLVFFGLLMPWSAIKTARRLKERSYPQRRKYFLMVIGQQIFFLLLSLFIARIEWLPIFTRPKNLWSFGVAAAILVTLIAVMKPRWRKAVEKRERRAYLFMSGEGKDKLLWAAISLLAGIGEEVTYRGVMFLLLWRVTGSALVAALIAAVVFGVSHYLQGWKSAALIAGFALIFQWLYWISGSLLAPMILHFVYDLTAGVMYHKFGRELGYPQEGFPPRAD